MKQIPNNIDSLRLLHEILFALNIGLATAFALRTYIDLPRQQWLAERFHLWADKLLGLQENNDAWVRIQFVGTMLGSAAIVFLLLILLRAGPRPLHRAILDPLACALALAAAPALWIAAILIGGLPTIGGTATPLGRGVCFPSNRGAVEKSDRVGRANFGWALRNLGLLFVASYEP